MTAARMSHEDLTAYAGRLAEMRDEATHPRDVLAYSRALDALRAASDGQYGERPRRVALWAAVWRARPFRSERNSARRYCDSTQLPSSATPTPERTT